MHVSVSLGESLSVSVGVHAIMSASVFVSVTVCQGARECVFFWPFSFTQTTECSIFWGFNEGLSGKGHLVQKTGWS